MYIKDIAELAKVSISTVSKIVNGKDKGISPQTRERVLAIVKDYNYTPYSTALNNSNSKSFLIGFLFGDRFQAAALQEMLRGAMCRAQKDNYAIITCDSNGDNEREAKNITMLCRNRVDGVIWNWANEKSAEQEVSFSRINIPAIPLSSFSKKPSSSFALDYRDFGYKAAQVLTDSGHTRIGCVYYPQLEISCQFLSGFCQCMTEQGLAISDAQAAIPFDDIDFKILERGLTGFICFDERAVGRFKRMAKILNLQIPQDISLIGCCSDSENPFAGEVSMLMLPMRSYGAAVCGHLIDIIEKRESGDFLFDWNLDLDSRASIDLPHDLRRKEILVIGSINIDVLLNMDEFPQMGKTVTANTVNTIPGGKGLNQAVGAAKLGANVSLIAKVGADYEGSNIHALLQENKINTKGLATDSSAKTGKAYIYVHSNGDSSIVIFAGANNNLCRQDIEKKESLFMNAGYCLLPMELPLDIVGVALTIAKRHGVKTILKPTALRSIPDNFLRMVDYFVPNEIEANTLCPDIDDIKGKARAFQEKGARTVIITLGSKGCYVKGDNIDRFYDAESVKVLDTTGGADAFICTLAVYLNEQYTLDEAVCHATAAAGFCVSRLGTLPAMTDRTTLELYMSNARNKPNFPPASTGN